MAVDAVGGGGFHAAPVKKANVENQKAELAPKVGDGGDAKPQNFRQKGLLILKSSAW